MNWVKDWPTWVKWTVGIFVGLMIIGAIAGGSEEDSDSEKSSDDSSTTTAVAGKKSGDPESSKADEAGSDEQAEAEEPEAEEDDGCGIEATDDCTPEVGPKGKVMVDGLIWQIQSAEQAASIGDQTYGLGEEANGVYLVTKLKVTSTKGESVSISDEVVSLIAGEDTYASDSDGTFAAVGEGEDAFIYEDIGPNSTLEGVVVFDVPKSLIGTNLELEFGELGFGETTGLIEVPKV
jgi:hypothetical protein